MVRVLAALVLVVATGCAQPRVRVAARDVESSTITMCGNRRASEDDLTARAVDVCPGAKLLRCEEREIGARAMRLGHITHAKSAFGLCCTYRCE